MVRKIGAGAFAIGAIVCISAAVGVANAAPPRRGGGAPHPAAHAVAPHFAAPRAAPHFTARRAAPHFTARHAAPHFTARHAVPHFTARHAAPHFTARHVAPPAGVTHFNARTAAHTRGAAVGASSLAITHGAAAVAHGAFAHTAGPTDPKNFAARRHFAGDPALRPFLDRGWHRNGHLGWVGPLFWPYAYGDLFYSALWPYAYDDDPFWAYGYDDIYAGIFSPYDYEPYVEGPQAPARMAALTQGMTNACAAEAAEVTAWPIDQIQQVIQPNDQQKPLLDDLGNAVVKASGDITAHCPAAVAFTPVDRLGQMAVRLQGMIDAVNIIEPPLTKFYDSLSDEQKARFNDMGVAQVTTSAATAANGAPNPQPNPQAAQAANPQQACGNAKVMAWPTDKIDQLIQPIDAQKQKLQALQSAAAQSADIIKAACPSELPATPPDRFAAIGARLNAQLKAVQTVAAPLQDFYDSLSDEQKARFNNLGREIFAEK